MSRKPQMIFAILILLVVVSVGSVVVAGPTCAFCNERTVRCCDNGYKCTGCGEKDHTTCHLHKYQATSCTNIKKCSCGKTTGAHSYSVKEVSSKYLKSAMTCTSQAVYYYKCSGCSAKGTGTYKAGSYAGHDYEGTWSKDSTYHWHKCKNCSYQTGKMAHQYNGNLSICVSDKKCTDCGYVAQKALGHDYGTTYESDDNYHWIKCNRTGCNALKLKESHNKTGTCVCGYKSEIEIDYIDIENAPNFLKVGESAKLQVYISPENATNKIIGWGSSNSNIVSVKNGTIYGVAPGTAIIAAVSTTAYGKAKDSCKITVLAECSADGIIDSHGDACKTFYKWDYEDDEAGYNTHSLWWECTKCENEWKASTEQKQPHNLDGNGNCRDCGYPSGKKHTCDKKVELCLNELSTLTHHTLELSCSVCGERQGTKEEKHTAPNKDGKCSVCGTKLVYEPEVIYLNKNSVSLEIGKTFQLEAEIVPATVNTKNKITYISSNSSIVSVSSNGLVTAKKAGTVTVTVRTENGKTARCTVTVKVCGKDYTVSGHYGSKTTSFTNITSTTHDAVITCTKCGTSYTNKAIGHKYLNNNGTECPCGYRCTHSGEKSTTYTKKVYATHTKVVRCTVCKTEINSTSESHKFNEFGICDCGYKCPHTGETKKDYQLEREMVHKEITKCANCGKIIDTVRIPKTSNANDEFDSTYTYISNNKHKIYLKCKTCNFTYNGEGSCTLVNGVCKFCNKKITSCSDKTHNHKLICDGKSTPYHKLYYKCDKLNITWEYDRDKMNLLIQSGEDICIACNKCMHISKKTNYITSADGHIKQEICKNSKCNKIVSTSAKENHKFANGVCTVCDYKCKHRKTTKKYENVNIENCKVKEVCDTCGSIVKESQIQHKIKNNKCENCNAKYNKCSLGEKHFHKYECWHNAYSGKDAKHVYKVLCTDTGIEWEEAQGNEEKCKACHTICFHKRVGEPTYKNQDDAKAHRVETFCLGCEALVDSIEEPHEFVNGVCSVCGYACKLKVVTTYPQKDENGHIKAEYCSVCNLNEVSNKPHDYDTSGKCKECGYYCKHPNASVVYEQTEKQHKKNICLKCKATLLGNFEVHRFESGVCTICKYECAHRSTTNEAKYKNESEHTIFDACKNCDAKKEVRDEPHDKNLELININWTNKEKHNILVKCSCGKFSKTEEHKYDDKTGECICGRSKDEEEKKCTKITVTSSTITAKTGNLISLRKYLKIEPASAKLNLKWYSSTRGKIELRANGNLIAKEKSNNIIVTVVDEVTGKSATIKVKAEGSNVEEPEKKEYVDVSKDSWYKENVDKATSEGMFNGVSDDKFAPEDNVTRGMFVTALARMDKADTKGYANLFDDVSDKAYYSESIAWASVNGIVNGIGNGKFAPEALMTREEMAVMIRNYINVQYRDVHLNTELANISAIETFADNDKISSWAKDAVYSLAEMGLLNGKGNGNFAPQDKVTRAEAATILVRLSEKMMVKITEK